MPPPTLIGVDHHVLGSSARPSVVS